MVLAAVFSGAWAIAGALLLERKRRGAPAMALLLSGLVGMFLTVVAATRLYGLYLGEAG